MNNAHIIILSNDFRLKAQIAEKLKADAVFTVDITALSLALAQTRLVNNMPNVLIIDIDTQKPDSGQIRLLIGKYNLHVIMTGKLSLMTDPAVSFVQKFPSSSDGDYAATAVVVAQKVRTVIVKASTQLQKTAQQSVDVRNKIIAVASSTGGTEALPVLLAALPAEVPPVLIVQHMPSKFTLQFADRINKMSLITVKEAENGEYLMKGTAYIAPGDFHMRLSVRQQRLAVECFFGDKLNGVRPAADILFESLSRVSGANAIGVILTGMGSDGARGLLEMHKKGSPVIGQDEASCVVYGMPKAARDLGVVDYQLPLNKIAGKIMSLL